MKVTPEEEEGAPERIWAREGSVGFLVEIIQGALADQGYQLKVTGQWGPETTRALQSIQRRTWGHDAATGELDSRSWQELVETEEPSLLLRCISALIWAHGLSYSGVLINDTGVAGGLLGFSLSNRLLTSIINDLREEIGGMPAPHREALENLSVRPAAQAEAVLITLRRHGASRAKYTQAIGALLASSAGSDAQISLIKERLWPMVEEICEATGKTDEVVFLAILDILSLLGREHRHLRGVLSKTRSPDKTLRNIALLAERAITPRPAPGSDKLAKLCRERIEALTEGKIKRSSDGQTRSLEDFGLTPIPAVDQAA